MSRPAIFRSGFILVASTRPGLGFLFLFFFWEHKGFLCDVVILRNCQNKQQPTNHDSPKQAEVADIFSKNVNSYTTSTNMNQTVFSLVLSSLFVKILMPPSSL